jgi:hypothetical protein
VKSRLLIILTRSSFTTKTQLTFALSNTALSLRFKEKKTCGVFLSYTATLSATAGVSLQYLPIPGLHYKLGPNTHYILSENENQAYRTNISVSMRNLRRYKPIVSTMTALLNDKLKKKKGILSCSASYTVSSSDQGGIAVTLSTCVREAQLSNLAGIPTVLLFLRVSLSLSSGSQGTVPSFRIIS